MSEIEQEQTNSANQDPNNTSFLVVVTQILGGTVLALLISSVSTYLWLTVELGEVSCSLDFSDLAGSGYGACIEALNGAPELLLGNLLVLIGAMLGVVWIGSRQEARGSILLASVVSAAVYVGTQVLIGSRVIDPINMLIDLMQFQISVTALQPALLASVSATLGYYMSGLWDRN